MGWSVSVFTDAYHDVYQGVRVINHVGINEQRGGEPVQGARCVPLGYQICPEVCVPLEDVEKDRLVTENSSRRREAERQRVAMDAWDRQEEQVSVW